MLSLHPLHPSRKLGALVKDLSAAYALVRGHFTSYPQSYPQLVLTNQEGSTLRERYIVTDVDSGPAHGPDPLRTDPRRDIFPPDHVRAEARLALLRRPAMDC